MPTAPATIFLWTAVSHTRFSAIPFLPGTISNQHEGLVPISGLCDAWNSLCLPGFSGRLVRAIVINQRSKAASLRLPHRIRLPAAMMPMVMISRPEVDARAIVHRWTIIHRRRIVAGRRRGRRRLVHVEIDLSGNAIFGLEH